MREWVEEMDCTKQTWCDSKSHFYFLSLIPSNCEWFGIKKKKESEMPSVCGLSRNSICSDMYVSIYSCMVDTEYSSKAICNSMGTLLVSFAPTFQNY